jgi:hypothetical protein
MARAADLSFAGAEPAPLVRNEAGILLIEPLGGEPYLMRTNVLARRLTRLSRIVSFAQVERISLWYTPSKLEQLLVFHGLAREHFPGTYRKLLRLPPAPYIKLLTNIPFPRTEITSRLAGRENTFFGPFRNRAEAEHFESEMLDFFQIRRCTEDLAPHPEHPGCIYGEMGQCLRPCQDVVGIAEYATEVQRLQLFLENNGEDLRDAIAKARERASTNLEFEEAARQHKRWEKLDALLRSASEITNGIGKVNGVSCVKREGGVDLYFLLDGLWREPVAFPLASQAGESMDRRLRQIVEELPAAEPARKDLEEHLALLHRWYFSSWRDTEWLPFASRAEIPYRRLVRMISRAANPAPATEPRQVGR